ncbi:MAG: Hsp20/alpha crystallin family protein [Syntrophaceae bacterium]|nr:Hsp20/alpha crystallin family protein [Syntrophaceae bacterium]
MKEEITQKSFLFFSSSWEPAADIYEDEREIKIVVDAAGVDPERLQITLEGRTLEIIGERSAPLQANLLRIHQMEIDYGHFSRRIQLPVPVVFERSQSIYKYGFLVIILPKKPRDEVIRISVEAE